MNLPNDETAPKPSIGRKLYESWLQIAARFAEVQTQVLVTFVYTIVLGPMGIGAAALRKDLLHKRGLYESGSAWSEADTVTTPDIERAKRLF